MILHPSDYILHTCTPGIPNQCSIIQLNSSDRQLPTIYAYRSTFLVAGSSKCYSQMLCTSGCLPSPLNLVGPPPTRHSSELSALRSQEAYESISTSTQGLTMARPSGLVASVYPSAFSRACSSSSKLRERPSSWAVPKATQTARF